MQGKGGLQVSRTVEFWDRQVLGWGRSLGRSTASSSLRGRGGVLTGTYLPAAQKDGVQHVVHCTLTATGVVLRTQMERVERERKKEEQRLERERGKEEAKRAKEQEKLRAAQVGVGLSGPVLRLGWSLGGAGAGAIEAGWWMCKICTCCVNIRLQHLSRWGP